MKKDIKIPFSESAWSIIESTLPDDENVKRVILDDFLWFMNTSQKCNDNKYRIKDYIRHLQLRAISANYISASKYFTLLNLDEIEQELISQFSC